MYPSTRRSKTLTLGLSTSDVCSTRSVSLCSVLIHHYPDLQVLQWWTEEFVRAITSSLHKMPYGMRYMARETLSAVRVSIVFADSRLFG